MLFLLYSEKRERSPSTEAEDAAKAEKKKVHTLVGYMSSLRHLKVYRACMDMLHVEQVPKRPCEMEPCIRLMMICHSIICYYDCVD